MIEIIEHSTLIAQPWYGGTKTTLFSDDEKKVRVSYATIEKEETEFSSMPGTQRTSLLVEGKITLIHDKQHVRDIPFRDIDEYSGSWHTMSEGKGTFINFFSKGDYRCSMAVLDFRKDVVYQDRNFADYILIHLRKGKLKTAQGIVNPMDTILVSGPDFLTLEVLEHSEIVHITILK